MTSSTGWQVIHLWEASTGREVRRLEPRTWPHAVNALIFTPDGKTLISGGSDISFWDVGSGRLERQWTGAESECFLALAITADGKTLASGNYKVAAAPQEWDVTVWDVGTQRVRHTLKGFELFVEGLAFAPDGKTLATASCDHSLKLWDVDRGREVFRFPDQGHAWSRLAFAPDGTTLAAGNWDGEVVLWDVAKRAVLHRIAAQRQPVHSLHYSRDGRLLATGGVYQSPAVWDVRSGKLSARLENFEAAWYAAFTDGDRTLVLWGGDHAIHLWDRARGKESPTGHGHGYGVLSLAISPDGKTAATASFDGIYVWDLASGKERFHLSDGEKRGFWCVAISPDGGTLASGGLDGFVRLWSAASGRKLRRWKASESQVFGVAYSPSGDTLYGCGYFLVEAWDAKTGQSRRRFGKVPPADEIEPGRVLPLKVVAVSPDGKSVAAYGARPRVWRTDTGAELDTGVADGSGPRVWDPVSGKARPWYSQVGSATSSLSVGGKYLAVGSDDQVVRILDAATGNELRVLPGCGWPRGLTADGRYLLTSQGLTSLLLWEALAPQKE
jgi:WD40 repeat protein